MNTSHWGTSVYLCESMRKRGRGKELRNKNPLSRYLSNRLCLPGDRDWHHFLLVSVCICVCVYTMSTHVKKKKRKNLHKLIRECVRSVRARLRGVHVCTSRARPARLCGFSTPVTIRYMTGECRWWAGFNLHASFVHMKARLENRLWAYMQSLCHVRMRSASLYVMPRESWPTDAIW